MKTLTAYTHPTFVEVVIVEEQTIQFSEYKSAYRIRDSLYEKSPNGVFFNAKGKGHGVGRVLWYETEEAQTEAIEAFKHFQGENEEAA